MCYFHQITPVKGVRMLWKRMQKDQNNTLAENMNTRFSMSKGSTYCKLRGRIYRTYIVLYQMWSYSRKEKDTYVLSITQRPSPIYNHLK